MAEWLGRGLQSLVQRFESARRLLDDRSGSCASSGAPRGAFHHRAVGGALMSAAGSYREAQRSPGGRMSTTYVAQGAGSARGEIGRTRSTGLAPDSAAGVRNDRMPMLSQFPYDTALEPVSTHVWAALPAAVTRRLGIFTEVRSVSSRCLGVRRHRPRTASCVTSGRSALQGGLCSSKGSSACRPRPRS